MHPLVGYSDRWSAKPGDPVRFMVSSANDQAYALRFVRHICADPNPAGPGYREIAMPTVLDGSHAGLAQGAWLGSFARAPGLPITLANGLSITATIWPTLPARGEQGIVALIGEHWRLTLGIGPHGGTMARLTTQSGTVTSLIDAPLLQRRWYDVALVLTAAGALQVAQAPHRKVGGMVDFGSAEVAATLAAGAITGVLLAAMPSDTAAPSCCHFDGKLEQPTVRPATSLASALDRQHRHDTSDALASWDFSIGIDSLAVHDTGPSAAHGELVNLPTRAMTGSRWTGAVHDWQQAPAQYGAIHFHSDDQGDLGWPEAFTLDIPHDWPSGFYSAHIQNAAGEDLIPFFVRPAVPGAKVAVLVPTFTYQVYSSYVRPGRGAEIAERAAQWGALAETPDMNREFGLSTYNYHADGSGVAITTQARPMLDTRPRQISLMDPVPTGSGTGRISADSYVIDWLTRLGIAHDIITDHDLHAEGAACLTPYRVVLALQHPEYHSERMMQGLAEFLDGGGRLMYLGGNGFYWRAEPSKAAPHALEVRRAEGGIRVWATDPGESYHAFGGGYGGLWRRVGRASHALVGSGFSSQGRHLGFPYKFTEGITDPRVAFITEGLDAAPGDVFGDSGFMGGGAAGFEPTRVTAARPTRSSSPRAWSSTPTTARSTRTC
jgi:N,N-dimethylformamidase